MQSESVFITKLNDETKTGRAVAVRLLKDAFLVQYCSMFFLSKENLKTSKTKDDVF